MIPRIELTIYYALAVLAGLWWALGCWAMTQ